MKEIISSPLLLTLVSIGLIYIVGFSLIYLKKAYTRCRTVRINLCIRRRMVLVENFGNLFPLL